MNTSGYEEKLITVDGGRIGIRGYSRGSLANFSQAGSMLGTAGLLAMMCAAQDFLLRLDTMGRPVVSMDIRGQVIRGSHVDVTRGKVISASQANVARGKGISGSQVDVTHGKPGNARTLTIKSYIDDIDAIRSALKVEKIALFGYSPGGFFCAHYAIANPSKMAALILAEPAIFSSSENLTKSVDLAFNGDSIGSMQSTLQQHLDPSLNEKDANLISRKVALDWQSPDLMGQVMELLANNQLSESQFAFLKNIPVLLIAGDQSHMKSHVERIARALPSANMYWIRGANHLDLMEGEYSKQIAQVTDQFLASL